MSRAKRYFAWLIAAPMCLVAAMCRVQAADDSSVAVEPIVERAINDDERQHWAYQPISTANPPECDDARWSRHPVDRFVKAKLDESSVAPLPRAGKATRLRRIYFDLTGLPPSAGEVTRFLRDETPDAYERVVDQLLASPAYGERYAQHWLDLARFAETDGFEHDLVRPNAWRYRDWVIDALNRDVPFDGFLRLQLAGDELRPGDPQSAVATGFLLCGPDMPDINLQDERRHLLLNEMTATVGAVFLGLQFGCAQCHDHKFDPITIHDFYRLRAFFESADVFREHPIPTPEELAAHQAAEAAWTSDDRQAEKRHRELEELGRKRFREKNPDERPTPEQVLAELSADECREHDELGQRLAALPKLPQLPRGRVYKQGDPQTPHVYQRGDFRRPGPVVECGFPAVLAENSQASANDAKSATGPRSRLDLANWLTQAEHPLTARVIANRVWQWHFGSGLVASPSDFGVMGVGPTHPELLDWLARELVRGDWSLKKFHRLLVTSEAYQVASGPFDAEWSTAGSTEANRVWQKASLRDPQNSLLWHRQLTRLDGEEIRDTLLAAGGWISERRGGPGVRPPLPAEVTSTLLKDQWQVTADAEDHRRRSIYLFVRRNLRYPLFDVFDRPDTNASCPQRHESTTATQSLTLLNSEFSLTCARRLAETLQSSLPESTEAQIDQAYLCLFGRHATTEEARFAEEFLQRQQALLREKRQAGGADSGVDDVVLCRAALVDFCLALMNASEAIYLD